MPYAGADFYCDLVLSGLATVKAVAEIDEVLAFPHAKPSFVVHIVVVPRRHIPSLVDLGAGGVALLGTVLEVVRDVAARVTAECGKPRVLTSLGSYQDSRRLHFRAYIDEPPRAGTPVARQPPTANRDS